MPDLKKLQDDARLALAQGDWVTAANLYATLEMMAPGEAAWPLRLGECLRAVGKQADAVAALTRAVAVCVQGDKAAEAATICGQILELQPDNAEMASLRDRLAPAAATLPVTGTLPFSYTATATPDFVASTVQPLPSVGSVDDDVFPNIPSESGLDLIEGTGSGVRNAAELYRVPTTASRRVPPSMVLSDTPFLQALNAQQLAELDARARRVQLSPGEVLYAAGEVSDALYLVASGEIARLVPQEVARLGPGDFFGEEVVLLPRHPRLATMRAAAPSQVFALARPLVEELVSGAPALLDLLSKGLRERLVGALARTSPMLATLPDADRLALLGRFGCEVVEAGVCMSEPGSSTAGLSILLAGDAEATFDRRLTERLHPGDAFGEIALVTDSPIAVRVEARERCLVLHLPQVELARVRQTWPQLAAYLAALADNRLARLGHAVLEDAPAFPSVPLPPRILLIHGEADTRQAYERALTAAGFLVDAAGDAATATDLITSRCFDVVVYSPDPFEQAGAVLLRNIRKHDLDVPIILTTRLHAFDYTSATAKYSVVRRFVEPIEVADLVHTASRAGHFHRLTRVRREAMTRLDSSGEWMGDRTGLEFHFENALGCLWMAFQPIVSAVDSTVFAYEALLRSGEVLLHSPLSVLRAAERLNRVHEVDRIARDRIAALLEDLADPTLVFVNVHSEDLRDPHLLDRKSHISRFAKQVVLEITERTPLDELPDLGLRIAELRALGYRFALDNLGAGHVGVGSLAQLEPEVCKLDASLVRGIDGDSVRQDLVRAMLAVCRDMNILTICHGVETRAERDTLLDLGGDLMQGYLFARPGPPFPQVDFAAIGLPPGREPRA